MAEEIKKSEFADLLGVSRGYVSQLVSSNRLVLSADGKLVRVRESLDLLAVTASVDKVGVAAKHALERMAKGGSSDNVLANIIEMKASAARTSEARGMPAPSPPPRQSAQVDVVGNPLDAYNHARAANELKRGRQMDLDYARDEGQLIGRDGTIKAVADLAAATRSAIERLPDRIATMLAAETDPNKVYAMLQGELDALCNTLSQQAETLSRRV